MQKWICFGVSSIVFCSLCASANERIRSEKQLTREGYLPAQLFSIKPSAQKRTSQITPHSLLWPVTFNQHAGTIGNTMVQYQPFDKPAYWHGGCDLLNSTTTAIIAPVTGKLDGGHYSYATNPDGSMKKFWKAWPQQGPATYFELAIITDDGVRFELHHVDRGRLSKSIVDRLNSPGSTIQAGEQMGFPVDAFESMNYTHVHYNLVMPDGNRINPEWVSQLIPDQDAPLMQGIYAVLKSGSVLDLGIGDALLPVREIILHIDDLVDGGVHQHPPVYFTVTTLMKGKFKTHVVWDFREKLLAETGKFPALTEFFVTKLKTPSGKTLETTGGYGQGTSLIRIPLDISWTGPITIEWQDTTGNSGQISTRLP